MVPTVKDVAKKAGVSPSTVSRVINDHPSISAETKQRVRKIMDEMGYFPNVTARNLGTQKANSVGVILPPLDSRERLGNPFYLEILTAVNEAAAEFQVTTAVASAANSSALLENVTRMHRQKQVDGFILAYSEKEDPIATYLYREKIPFTLIGRPPKRETDIVYVDNDNQLLGKQATEHLISKGHENILFVSNVNQEVVFFERYFGYQEAMMLQGLPTHPPLTMLQAEDYTDFPEVIKQTGATALVVIDDIFALRMIQLANLHGYKVPDDLSVISFNNSIFATLVHPYLTTIDIDISDLGRLGTQKLMEQIEQKQASGVQLVVPHHLIQRETVRAL
ncbi:LacI family DNA-binding transcriptional regulator [Enterococcus pseudoavium]|uniref:LacI family DNA-binding transcriptional regulator n=1 Tax=Enterococcus pseudoavium TaxID=44007 RepID=A0ABU3FHJ1_9ENTE|nr:LacI family DNA-binding transcriptional regulator [Enterococcus pseudoavium]MDT2754946.1 LacI family DNA-binding transcriptional regulator [Enterococcus pseudoavium]MDT2770215.1 LacI family DNA-binding transcriptional regulator [Enterococcus pseudoavium]REC33340.1 LacI family transcriptional regulator [Enterococcus pseudoavium]